MKQASCLPSVKRPTAILTRKRGLLMKALLHFYSTLLLLTFSLMTPSAGNAASTRTKPIILATTTSTQDSGLLDLPVPLFEKERSYKVKTIAVGSGQAMKMGEKGGADILPTLDSQWN